MGYLYDRFQPQTAETKNAPTKQYVPTISIVNAENKLITDFFIHYKSFNETKQNGILYSFKQIGMDDPFTGEEDDLNIALELENEK